MRMICCIRSWKLWCNSWSGLALRKAAAAGDDEQLLATGEKGEKIKCVAVTVVQE